MKLRKSKNNVAQQKGTRISLLVPLLLLVLGLGIMLYPVVSEIWNSYHASYAIQNYDSKVDALAEQQKADSITSAQLYNEELFQSNSFCTLPDTLRERYNKELSVDVTGIMGYVEIESINVRLPIFHGTDEASLQVGAGHVDWSSLPVGGINTHCVISGHTGLPTATLFNDLYKLKKGDHFSLVILDQTLTYEVDTINKVLPEETAEVSIVKGQDLCTLLTCTPYGQNTHRLLVRGHRIYPSDKVDSGLGWNPPLEFYLLLGAVFIALLVALFFVYRKRRQKKRKAWHDRYVWGVSGDKDHLDDITYTDPPPDN